jgi:cell division transport system permease protein
MALTSLGRLSRRPAASLMTGAVIGIALALPGGLQMLVENVRAVSGGWDGSAGISLFLAQDIDDARARAVEQRLADRADVAGTRLVSRAEALDEFRRLSGFGDALDLLEDNPLPAVVLLQPAPDARDADTLRAMALELQRYREIDLAQVDLQWVERLAAITRTVERGVLILVVLLALAVLLIVGNTVRLEIQGRRIEIEVIKLVGGTDAFIRRPFLYDGFWYGLLGALIAAVTIGASLWLLDGPVSRLAGLYASDFSLALLDPLTLAGVLIGGPLLGLLGAWLAVGRHLADIEPE